MICKSHKLTTFSQNRNHCFLFAIAFELFNTQQPNFLIT